MVEEILNATNQPATPTAEAYSAALLSLISRLRTLPDFGDKWHTHRWLITRLHPATEAADDPLASDAAARLLALAASHDAWTRWCAAAFRLLHSPLGSRDVVHATLNEPGLVAITEGLVDAVRQVQVRRAA